MTDDKRYPPLPKHLHTAGYLAKSPPLYTAAQMKEFADAACALRGDELDKLHAQLAEVHKDAELERALQQAAKDLPAHFVICVNVERDAGWVQLYGSDGDIMEFALEDLTLAEQVRAAIDAAKGER